MPVEVIMPKVDMDMTTGRIARWHVGEGDMVAKHAALFDIETDKATMEVEAPAAGRLHLVRAATGEDIPVGEAVAWLYAEGEPLVSPPQTASLAPAASAPPAPPKAPLHAPAVPQPDKIRATPLARRRARETGIDLAAVQGTSLHGRITSADVDAAGARRVPRPRTSGAIPILLLHGFAADSTGWAKLEPHLAGQRLLRLDLPNHGGGPRASITGFADLAARMRAAFDALPDTLVHLVGHSLGGAVAVALADTRPRRIASLTLIAPAGLGAEIDGPALAGITRASQADSLAPWLRRLPFDPGLVTDAYARAAMAARADETLRAAQSAMAQALFPDGTQAFDLTAALDRLAMPVRIVWGRNDTIIPWQHALRAPGRMGLHLYPQTGHLPHIERAAETAMVIQELAQSAALAV